MKMVVPDFVAPQNCCSCLGPPSQQVKITSFMGVRPGVGKGFGPVTTFRLPICSECAKRIRLKKLIPLLLFALVIGIGFLFPLGSRNRDMFVGVGIALEISVIMFIVFNFFDPASWWHGRFLFKNEEFHRLFSEANPAVPASRHKLFPYEKIW